MASSTSEPMEFSEMVVNVPKHFFLVEVDGPNFTAGYPMM